MPDDDGEPWVVKPIDGAGCEATRLSGEPGPGLLRQRWVDGEHVSVSFLIHADTILALPAGQQKIEIAPDRSVRYRGGVIPLPPDQTRRATALATRAVACVPGLRGYVGVDLVLGRDGRDVALEINPRLTMSYLGLSRLCRGNLAQAMLDPETPLVFADDAVEFDA